MDQIIINAELNLDDWHAYQRAATQYINQQGRVSQLGEAAIALVITLVLAATLGWFGIEFSIASFAAGLVLMIALLNLTRRRLLKNYVPRANGAYLGPCTYILDSTGIRTQRDSMGSQFGWSDIVAIGADATHLYFWVDSNAALTLPLRALPAELPASALQQQIAQWRPNSEALPSAATIADASPTQSSWPRTLFNLWVLRRVEPAAVPFNALPIAIIACVALALLLGLDRYNAGTHPDFYANNIPVIALYALVALTIAWILSRDAQPHVHFGQALFVVAGGIPLLIALLHVTRWLTHPWTLLAGYAAIGVYLLCYVAKALHWLSGTRQLRAATAALVLTALFAAINSTNFWTPQLWYPPEAEAADTEHDLTWNNSESLLFEQQQRLDHALSTVAATAPGEPATYFLGFAGVAEQKVFAEEISLAAKVVDDRYHTNTRSVQLVNDRRDLTSLPLATVSNLHYALQGLAGKMNVDQDILFLALSSHGDDEPSLQVSNGYLSLQQVTGDNLAQALRDSGIKWRVIVISACHAGSFIEPLKDPYTIIITAAAADKTSFGCADDRDLTYFGEAFYRDALPGAASLEDAFARAKAAIADREKSEKIKASDPQAYFGAELSTKLQQLH